MAKKEDDSERNGIQRMASFLADFFAVWQTARNMDQISGTG